MYASVAEERRWIGAEAPVGDRRAEIVDHFVDRGGAILFPAEVEGAAVGWISADVVDGGGAVEVGMGIVDGHRRQGIGTRMMQAAIEWARGRRATRVRLDVFPHNETAIGLYRSLGFEVVAAHEAAWRRRNGERWDLVAMELDLIESGSS